jgi:RHS repeat-associated protein
MTFYGYGNNDQRNQCWDEMDRLMGLSNGSTISQYIYDANGERSMKFTGGVSQVQINQTTVIDFAGFDHFTYYVNPYLVMTDQNYTKHYYIEGQRIMSKIGGGMDDSNIELNAEPKELCDIYQKGEDIATSMDSNMECFGLEGECEYQFNTDWIQSIAIQDEYEVQMYFYHPDHLGSSSFITDLSGDAIQHLEYLPFGEPFIEEKKIDWGTPYRFTGKELDPETNYNYFGARYYDPAISIWLSVDPLSDKYPSASAYAYCMGNPVRLVDPDGRSAGDYYNEFGVYLGSDGIDDRRTYVVSQGAVKQDIPYKPTSLVSTEHDYNSSMEGVNYIGTQNEFGLIQLTEMENPCIQNNVSSEDSYSYQRSDGSMSDIGKHGDDWVSPSTGAGFYGAVNRSGSNVVVNDASAYNPNHNLGHIGHRNGNDIDFRYITSTDVGANNTNGLSSIDILLNQNFIMELKASGFNPNRIFSDGTIPGTIKDRRGIHDNHIHAGR